MSYQGFQGYTPIETVDETADYTDMQGDMSMANHASANSGAWWNDATKSLVITWFVVMGLYWAIGFFFRKYLA